MFSICTTRFLASFQLDSGRSASVSVFAEFFFYTIQTKGVKTVNSFKNKLKKYLYTDRVLLYGQDGRTFIYSVSCKVIDIVKW
ncbi:unnamed protein product [Acanthoscelides obtectus]|uniref:Uncharacterized protein n=1 Tax=Acanthoscelides obtectus TaxID=200917 RepID=A0A9P0QGY4_ACAOB|nr:unnamed protein product [Acanthoscelides obtectus]CAK1648871.1 hypothetical protein AOBTE_LOCUS15938 [Acanthoscelides obtectus]